MSIDIGRRVTKHDYGDLFAPYTGVTVNLIDGNTSFTSGDDSGRILTIESPWASQRMADNLLAQVRGAQHQPFTATGAILDPATELGDVITVDGVTGIMYRRSQRFGTLYRPDISAPGDEEINHEIPYYPPIQRAVTRIGGVARAAAAAAERAQSDILQDRKNLIAALNREDGAPEDLLAGFDSYVRWDMKNSEGYAASSLFAQIGERARAEINLYAVEADGKTKTFAEILADQITLEAAVDDAFTELALKADSDTVTALDGRVTTIMTAQAELATRVGQVETTLSQKAEQSTVEELDGSLQTLYTGVSNLSTRVGNAESSLSQKVSSKEFQDVVDAYDEAFAEVQESVTSLSSRVGNTEASLTLKASSETVTALDGKVSTNSQSIAILQADLIKLQGDVEIVGDLSISEGKMKVAKGVIANGNSSIWGDLNVSGKFFVNGKNFYVGGEQFAAQSITSADGSEYTVLGCA